MGTFVAAEIDGRVVEDVIRIPRSALRGNRRLIVVNGENRLEIRSVDLLRADAHFAYLRGSQEEMWHKVLQLQFAADPRGVLAWMLEQGLGTTLVNHLISTARLHGLRHLTCMPIAKLEQDAIDTLAGLGFEQIPIPGYGADPDGNPYDMVKLVLTL